MTKKGEAHPFDETLNRGPVEASAFDRAFNKAFPELDNTGNSSPSGAPAGDRSAFGTSFPFAARGAEEDELASECQFVLALETPIKDPKAKGIDPIDTLDPTFCRVVNFKKVPGAEPERVKDFVVCMRRPWPEVMPGAHLRYVATDSDRYGGRAVFKPEPMQAVWCEQINIRRHSIEFITSAMPIWKMLNIQVSREQTAFMTHIDNIDQETADAYQAALFCAFNTAQYPIDMETASLVLNCFLHADPLRKHLVGTEPFVHPFGERTQYGLFAGAVK